MSQKGEGAEGLLGGEGFSGGGFLHGGGYRWGGSDCDAGRIKTK